MIILFKSALIVEVWDYDIESDDEKIDDFTFLLYGPLSSFCQSSPITSQDNYGIGNLTLIYGNLRTDSTSCKSAVQPTFIANSYTPKGIQYVILKLYMCIYILYWPLAL